MVLVPLRLAGSWLSQGALPLTVVVVDPRGTPFVDAEVTLQGRATPEKTNSSGIATFHDVPAGDAIVQVDVSGFVMKARGTTDQTLFVTVPVCAPGPILTPVEIGAILLGGAAVVYGISKKLRALEMAGELVAGASIFSSLYRASCRW